MTDVCMYIVWIKCVYIWQKYLLLCCTCPFQITSDRWVGCNFNTDMSIGPGCVWSIRPAFAAAILHKNDKQLARNRHDSKKTKKQKQSKKYSQKTSMNIWPLRYFQNLLSKKSPNSKFIIKLTIQSHIT